MGFHDMRNLLGTLSNEIDSALAAHHDEDSNVLEAALAAASETHYEAVRLLDKLEVNSSSSVDSSDRQSTLRSLQQLWLSIFPPGPYQDIHLETEQESILFDLPGSPESLGRALSNFFDHKTPISEMLTGPSDDAQISLSLDLSASFLRVECCFAPLLPPHVEEALRSVSVDRRLPSTKNQGGRGLLSAISVIRNDFSGTIHFGNNPDLGFRWEVMIPISIVRQYRLFPEVF
jgi:hypothetical protein